MTSDLTYVHSTILLSTFNTRHKANANLAPAHAVESVAEPAPALQLQYQLPVFLKLFFESFSKSIQLVFWKINRWYSLRDKRNDCDTKMTSNNRNNINISRIQPLYFSNKWISSHNIQGGDSKYTVGIIDTSLF